MWRMRSEAEGWKKKDKNALTNLAKNSHMDLIYLYLSFCVEKKSSKPMEC